MAHLHKMLANRARQCNNWPMPRNCSAWRRCRFYETGKQAHPNAADMKVRSNNRVERKMAPFDGLMISQQATPRPDWGKLRIISMPTKGDRVDQGNRHKQLARATRAAPAPRSTSKLRQSTGL